MREGGREGGRVGRREMSKLARLFLFLVFCTLVAVSVPLIYLMSKGSKETVR